MKALVLSSGGVDSTTCVGMAVEKYGKENVVTASIIYGQKHSREVDCAAKIAEYYGVKHIEEDISVVMKYAGNVCTLMKSSEKDVPEQSYAEQLAQADRPSTEVPFRNGVFLSVAAAYAMSLFPDDDVDILYGAHKDDAAGRAYPDCSPEFADAMNAAISVGSRNRIHLARPLINWNKAQVVKEGLRLHVPYHLTTSCYNGRECACQKCGTCIDRIMAFRLNNAIDPISYEGSDPFEDMR